MLRPGGRLAVDDRCVPEDDRADALIYDYPFAAEEIKAVATYTKTIK